MQNIELSTTAREGAVVSNPFGESLESRAGVMPVGHAQAVSHEVAEMQAQIYLAKQFPRDQRRAMEQILTACQRPGLAATAVYRYAKGGSDISGPSIRLAEELARSWGNIECGWNEVERESDASKVKAYAWDKESNVFKTLVFFVPHYRSSRRGRVRIDDERELYELLANQAARRMRNCILSLIPGDVVEAAVDQCERTLATHCAVTPETIKSLIDAFKAFGVTRKQLESRIQRNIEAIQPAQFVQMREIYTSLKDGISEPSDWFEGVDETTEGAGQSGTAALKNALAADKPRARAQKKALGTSVPPKEENALEGRTEPQNEEPQSAAATGNAGGAYRGYEAAINGAASREKLEEICESFQESERLTESQIVELMHLAEKRAAGLE